MTFRTHERKLRQLVVGIDRLVIIITMTGCTLRRRTGVAAAVTIQTGYTAVSAGERKIRAVMVKQSRFPA